MHEFEDALQKNRNEKEKQQYSKWMLELIRAKASRSVIKQRPSTQNIYERAQSSIKGRVIRQEDAFKSPLRSGREVQITIERKKKENENEKKSLMNFKDPGNVKSNQPRTSIKIKIQKKEQEPQIKIRDIEKEDRPRQIQVKSDIKQNIEVLSPTQSKTQRKLLIQQKNKNWAQKLNLNIKQKAIGESKNNEIMPNILINSCANLVLMKDKIKKDQQNAQKKSLIDFPMQMPKKYDQKTPIRIHPLVNEPISLSNNKNNQIAEKRKKNT